MASVKGLGNSSVLKTSRLWLIVVPLAVKALAASPNPILIPSLGISLSLDLPFSWKAFYFASVLFAIAGLIFDWKCPTLIKNYKGYQDFHAEHYNDNELVREVYKLRYSHLRRPDDLTQLFLAQYTDLENPQEIFDGYSEENQDWVYFRQVVFMIIEPVKVLEEHRGSAFHAVRFIASISYPIFLWACGLLYVGGFVLLGWVLIQNFIYVAKHV